MIHTKRQIRVAVGVLTAMLVMSGLAYGDNFTPVANQGNEIDITNPPQQALTEGRDTYSAYLKLYVNKPESDWKDKNGGIYAYGFLDYALDTVVMVEDGMRHYRTGIWAEGVSSVWNPLEEDNIMVTAVLFNTELHVGYADPPNGNAFFAYYNDAAAAALAGTSDSDDTGGGYTHTVFVEEGTATW